MDPGAPPKQAGRNDPRIVQYEEFVSAQQIGEFREQPVFEGAGKAAVYQQSSQGERKRDNTSLTCTALRLLVSVT